MEVVLLGLEPVERLVVGVEALARDARVEVEQHGEVGQQALGRPQREVADLVAAEHAAGALVGDRRVEVAVLDDDVAALERGAHDGRDVVRAVGGVEQRLGARRDLAAVVQHDVADQHADLGAAGLAGAHDGAPARGEPLLEQRGLRRLADAVAALERDEQTGLGPPSLLRRRLARGRASARACAWARALGALVGEQLHGALEVISSTSSPRGIVAFVSPSVTYGPKRPSLTLIGLPLTGSASNSLSALDARRAPYFGWA